MASSQDFLSLFLDCQGDLRAFLGSLVRDRNNMEDLFQETSLTLWEKFDSYDPARPFGAWARGIAANKVLQFKDQQGRVPAPFSPAAIQAMVEAFDRPTPSLGDVHDALEKCLAEVPDDQRAALHAWHAEDRSIESIAKLLQVSTATAYKTLQRLRLRLLECVQRRMGISSEEARR